MAQVHPEARLRLLTGAVIVAALVAIVAVMAIVGGGGFVTTGPGTGGLGTGGPHEVPLWMPGVLIVLVAVANAAVVRVRVRSTVVGTSWTDAAALVCIVCLPPEWVPASVGLGVLVAKLLSRVAPRKSAYNAAKDTLATTAGLAVAVALGVSQAARPLDRPLAVVAVALTIFVAEMLVGLPVIALATQTRWSRVHVDLDIKALFFGSKLCVAVLFLWLRQLDPRLLAIIPPVAFCLHLLYSSRLRGRDERSAWARLATASDELNRTDPAQVLAAAVTHAAPLFAADWVEVYLPHAPSGPVLVRGNADGVAFVGDPLRAPSRGDGESVISRLADDGELRLLYAGRVSLTDRERDTLRTFVTALDAALRNASASLLAQRLDQRFTVAAGEDQLTGLASRARLLERGAAAVDESVLAIIDIRHFREINEAVGSAAGDRVLVEVGRRLARAVGADRVGDRAVVARLGADTFAVLVVADARALAAPLEWARTLLGGLDASIDLGPRRVRVEACVGVARPDGPAGSVPMAELLRRADVAVMRAKRQGSPVAAYDPARDPANLATLSLGGELRRALAEGEITVLFQPIVDLRTGMMLSAEALARWRHPELGELGPLRFIATVERSELLPAFAEEVLDQSLAGLRRWRSAGFPGTVAVNASPRSLLDPAFPLLVQRLLERHGVAGRDLVIELTENLTSSQVELAGPVLARLRELGIKLALDDFGTDHSSLNLVDRVPVAELKIDRSFITAMADSPRAAAVVRSTVELGRRLGLLVVAEGVESAEQRRALADLGCAAGQGYLFSRPVPAQELVARLVTGVDGGPGRLGPPMSASRGLGRGD